MRVSKLEGDERTFERHVIVGVKEATKRSRERERVQPVEHILVLHLRDEVADRALFGRALGD